MNLTWNLDELFKSVDDCYKAFATIDDLVERLEEYKGATITSDNLPKILDDYFAIKELAYKCLVYGSLRYYRDFKNEETKKLKTDCEEKNTETIGAIAFIDELLLREGCESIMGTVDENESLAKYRLFLDDLFRRDAHAISTPETVELKKEIDGIIKEYNELVDSISFEPIMVGGKEIELSHGNVQKYLVARDAETRKSTFKELNRAYREKLDAFADILNRLFAKRMKLARLEGYKTVCEKALDLENIDPKILEDLIEVVHSKVTLLQRYMGIKAKHFGLDEAHLYDLSQSIGGDISSKYPLEEALDIAKEAFAPMGEEYISTAMNLLNSGHVDALLDNQKHPTITFSWLSYSFLNYHETYGDIKNLVHELGHSINDYLSKDLPFPYRISSVFIGETASIVNEILLSSHLIKKSADAKEKSFYLTKEIDNYITSVYRQTMYTELELKLYDHIEKGNTLTSDFLSKTYFDLLKAYYGNRITYDDESSCEWTRLDHLIRWEFYPYKYATGLLIASTVHTNLMDGTLSSEEYRAFLAAGSQKYSLDLLKDLHIDPKDLSVLEKGFTTLEEDLAHLESIIQKEDYHI